MKKIKRIMAFAFSMLLFATSFSFIRVEQTSAYTTYSKLEIEDMQLNKARIKSGSGDSGGKHVETYWQQDPLDSFDKLTDITFARTVLEADEAGDYMLQVHCKNEAGGDITVKFYVNGTAYDLTVSGSGYQTVNKTVSMKKGQNSIVLAWVNWGFFDYINYPQELKIVNQSTDTKYYAFESKLNEVQLTPTNAFHNASATLYTAPIIYDSGDEEWQGSATFTVNASENVKSMDLHYYVSEYSGSSASLAMSVNSGKEVKIDLSGKKTNEELTKTITQKVLNDAGFKKDKANTIKFRQSSSSGGKVGIYFIELSEEDVKEEETKQVQVKRYESEGAYVISGAQIKSADSSDEEWSKKQYVGEFTGAKISKSSQIDEYCSNVGYIEYHVNADKQGYYKVTLAYATETEGMSVYATSGYEWSKVKLSSTGAWNAVGKADTYVYLKKGANSIWITGPTTTDGWVNYDYIDVAFDEAASIDTSNTVLLMDQNAKGGNSDIIAEDEPETEKSDDVEGSGELDDDTSSLISPNTRDPIIVFLVVLAGIALGTGIFTYRKTKENN